MSKVNWMKMDSSFKVALDLYLDLWLNSIIFELSFWSNQCWIRVGYVSTPSVAPLADLPDHRWPHLSHRGGRRTAGLPRPPLLPVELARTSSPTSLRYGPPCHYVGASLTGFEAASAASRQTRATPPTFCWYATPPLSLSLHIQAFPYSEFDLGAISFPVSFRSKSLTIVLYKDGTLV